MRKLSELSKEEMNAFCQVCKTFRLGGEITGVSRLYQGHLHETYVSTVGEGEQRQRFLHQKINTNAFEHPEQMLSNIEIISQNVREHPDRKFPETLSLIPTCDGEPYYSQGGNFWRTYNYVEDSISYDVCPDAKKGYALGKATGDFLYLLSNLGCNDLHDYTPGFQDTSRRWGELGAALESAATERAEASRELYEQMLSYVEDAHRIHHAVKDGRLRQQIIHGDTKTNNFLFREDSDEVLCLVDIDLCMPATPLYDIGDLVRSASAVGREDERDLTRVGVSTDIMQAVIRGFQESVFQLTDAEHELLPYAGFTVSFNLTARFLADYLRGDVYFPVARPDHNLERARAQWRVTTCLHSFRGVIERLSAPAAYA